MVHFFNLISAINVLCRSKATQNIYGGAEVRLESGHSK